MFPALTLRGVVKTTYTFSTFLMPFLSNFRFAWCQQAGEGGCYDMLAERYGEHIRCFTRAQRLVLAVAGFKSLNLGSLVLLYQLGPYF